MVKFKVFVTRKIPQSGIKLLKKKGHTVRVFPKDRVINRKELEAGVKWCDALLPLLTEKIDGTLMDLNPNLKVIANYAVGFNNIDVEAATKRGIKVGNTPGVLTDAVADHACALMLSTGRRIVESDKFVRTGKYKSWEPMLLLGTDFKDRTLGIVGSGRIGGAVAERMYKGFGMKVVYYDIKRNPRFEKATKGKYMSLMNLAKKSDFISVHVPLFPSTHHLINRKFLNAMKKTAILVNTSRGPVVDEKALVAALKAKKIAGAGLDVFEKEPKLMPGLAKLDNAILTPHTASATVVAREAMSTLAAQNIAAVAAGKNPPYWVNGPKK